MALRISLARCLGIAQEGDMCRRESEAADQQVADHRHVIDASIKVDPGPTAFGGLSAWQIPLPPRHLAGSLGCSVSSGL